MEKPTIRALLLAAAIVAPHCVALVMEHAPIKRVEEFTTDELRYTLRATNFCVYVPEPIEEIFDGQRKQTQ